MEQKSSFKRIIGGIIFCFIFSLSFGLIFGIIGALDPKQTFVYGFGLGFTATLAFEIVVTLFMIKVNHDKEKREANSVSIYYDIDGREVF